MFGFHLALFKVFKQGLGVTWCFVSGLVLALSQTRGPGGYTSIPRLLAAACIRLAYGLQTACIRLAYGLHTERLVGSEIREPSH